MFSQALFFFLFMESILKAESRYCSFEIDGEVKYYVCHQNEYCCNFGCCLSPTFQFYQLWYYWLMVIFMFLLCSGGQWWYRYWLQGRYSGEMGSTMPYRAASNHIAQSRRPPRPARVAYHPARDTVVLQNIWKPNYPGNSSRSSPPPSYSSSGSATQPSRDLIDIERLAGVPKPSSYFQSLGPPPTYEQAIRESTGTGEVSSGPCPISVQSVSVDEVAPRTGDPTSSSLPTSASSPAPSDVIEIAPSGESSSNAHASAQPSSSSSADRASASTAQTTVSE